MKRSYLLLTLALAALLMTAGCADKTVTAQEEIAVPAVTQSTSQPTTVEQAISESSKPETMAQPAKPEKPEASRVVTVYFGFDSYLLSEEARQQLKVDAAWLKEHPEEKATLEGHCDERGSDGYNLALGERRAAAAKQYLAELGIAPERLATISFGEERPAVAGHTELAWEKNRRVEFK